MNTLIPKSVIIYLTVAGEATKHLDRGLPPCYGLLTSSWVLHTCSETVSPAPDSHNTSSRPDAVAFPSTYPSVHIHPSVRPSIHPSMPRPLYVRCGQIVTETTIRLRYRVRRNAALVLRRTGSQELFRSLELPVSITWLQRGGPIGTARSAWSGNGVLSHPVPSAIPAIDVAFAEFGLQGPGENMVVAQTSPAPMTPP